MYEISGILSEWALNGGVGGEVVLDRTRIVDNHSIGEGGKGPGSGQESGAKSDAQDSESLS